MTPKKGAETSEERPIDATELTPSTEVAASDPAHPVAIDADCEPTPTIAAESPEAAQLQGSRRRHRLLAGSALGLCSAAGLALSLLLLAGNANLPLTGNAALPGASPSGPNATLAYGTDVDGTGTPAVQERGGGRILHPENAENAAPSESSSSNGGASENGPWSLHDDEVSGTSNWHDKRRRSGRRWRAPIAPGSAPASGGASNAAGGQSGSSSAPASSSTSSDSSGALQPVKSIAFPCRRSSHRRVRRRRTAPPPQAWAFPPPWLPPR